jgi:phenylacetate-CoA ligase
MIRNNKERLKSEIAKKLVRTNTGGSTGAPLIFFLGKRRISADIAAKIRSTRWWEVDIGDKEIVLWGSPVELGKQDIVRSLRDWILRTRLLSAFNMSEKNILKYISIIKQYKPKQIFGYPSSIYLLSRHAKQIGYELKDIGVNVIFCTAEKLYDYQREFITKTFNAPVANGYGGRDAGFIAHECPFGGMHIAAENVIVEIIDRNGNPLVPGERGEIVVTHLESHDFPFIRYRTGDIGTLSDKRCTCGRGLPLIERIDGRTTDFIVTHDGRIVHGLSLIYVMREIEGIREFKITQNKVNEFIVSIVKDSMYNEDNENHIRDEFKKRIGKGSRVFFEYLDEIKPEGSGKFRYVVSNVHSSLNSLYDEVKIS